jgi:hypothetical protein
MADQTPDTEQSTQRSMHDFAVAANPALYRVVIEAAAE